MKVGRQRLALDTVDATDRALVLRNVTHVISAKESLA